MFFKKITNRPKVVKVKIKVLWNLKSVNLKKKVSRFADP